MIISPLFIDTRISDITTLYIDPKTGDRLDVICQTLVNGSFALTANIASWSPAINPLVAQQMHELLNQYGLRSLERRLRRSDQRLCWQSINECVTVNSIPNFDINLVMI